MFRDSEISYSAASAYALLKYRYDEEKKELPFQGYIDITEQIKKGESINHFIDLEMPCLWCYTLQDLGENKNKIQFSIENNVQPGTKDWETKYVLIADFPKSGKAITIAGVVTYDYKLDAEKAAKVWCTENKRDVHIKTVKIMKDSDPVTTSIFYKPSPQQELCEYKFVN